jgi:hypothetical protein
MSATAQLPIEPSRLFSRCTKSDERLSFQRPLRERNPRKMGEAPVKYELTGAS